MIEGFKNFEISMAKLNYYFNEKSI